MTIPATAPPRVAIRRRFVITTLVVLSVVLAAHLSDVRLGALFDAGGSASASALFAQLLRPDVSSDFLVRIATLSVESLFIGVLGTCIAAALGLTLALGATRVPRLPDPPDRSAAVWLAGGAVRFLSRSVLAVLRSVPDLVWAFLFVRLFGLGPGPAVLAIGLSTGGIMGKLFAELAEAADPLPVHALRRSGAGRIAAFLYGVVPQVRKQWVSYAVFRLECSLRSASILGIVGAGGLGSEIALSVRYFQYDKLATALLAVLVYVIAFELLSSVLRRRRIRWTFGFAAVVSAASLVYLDIPWREMGRSGLLDSLPGLGVGSELSSYLARALRLTLETVAMAWCATIGAAVLAFLWSPFAASTFAVGGYLANPPGSRRTGRIVRRIALLFSRLPFQVTRAMPELTLALMFVVWVGPGAFAGVLAIGVHTIGVLGRLYADVYDEVERPPVAALEASGASRFPVWLYGVLPQVGPRLLAFTLYRFEVNVRATAMVGFVGAGGIGDALDTAISLFHIRDLVVLLVLTLAVVTIIDWFGDRARHRLLTASFAGQGASRPLPWRPQNIKPWRP